MRPSCYQIFAPRYGFFYHFNMDGSIEHETKLTGILSTGALAEAEMEPAEDADPTDRARVHARATFAPVAVSLAPPPPPGRAAAGGCISNQAASSRRLDVKPHVAPGGPGL